MPAPSNVQSASDAPMWIPKSPPALPGSSPTEHFGRRLNDAITERGGRAKARSGAKGNGARVRPGNGDAAKLPEGAPRVHEQLSAPPRTRGNGAAKKRAAPKAERPPPVPRSIIREEMSQLERFAPEAEAANGNGSNGWPQQWANGQSAAEVHAPRLHQSPLEVVDREEHAPQANVD
jgi:hypothetical protein